MANRKPQDTGGRVTLRDLMGAVASVYERVDGIYGRVEEVNERVDTVVAEQVKTTGALTNLRAVVNDEIHKIKADIGLLKRPWTVVGFAAAFVSRRSLLFVGLAVGALLVENALLYAGWPF